MQLPTEYRPGSCDTHTPRYTTGDREGDRNGDRILEHASTISIYPSLPCTASCPPPPHPFPPPFPPPYPILSTSHPPACLTCNSSSIQQWQQTSSTAAICYSGSAAICYSGTAAICYNGCQQHAMCTAVWEFATAGPLFSSHKGS